MSDLETVPCLLCQGSAAQDLYRFNEVTLKKCQDCHFVYTSPRFTAKARDRIYQGGYHRGSAEIDMDIDFQANEKIFLQDAQDRMSLLNRHLNSKNAQVLEIGSANGYFLAACQRSGLKATGIEISNEMVQFARNKLDVHCLEGSLATVPLNDQTFDAAALWHTLEHVENPVECLQYLSTKLKKSGLIVITVPNIESGNAKKMKAAWRHLEPSIHLSHFSEKTLAQCLKICGYEIVEVQKSGSTGLFGTASALPAWSQKMLIAQLQLLNPLRRLIKQGLVQYGGKDDFITVVGKVKN